MLGLRSGFALLVPALLFACSSSNFAVDDANDAATDDSGSSEVATDASADVDAGPPDPCAPEPGKAKYCIDVKLARPDHPPYIAGSGATGLGLDGKGKIFIGLWSKDLVVGSAAPKPDAVITYPAGSTLIDVDKELPTKIVGSAAPDTYSVIGIFEDNLDTVRTGPKTTLAGDFIVVPEVKAGALVYPRLRLTDGTTQKLTLELRPWRKITVTVGISTELAAKAKTSSAVHGDGPMLLGLFDGADSVSDTTPFLWLDDAPCVTTNIQGIPATKTVNFGTTVEGAHNAFLALVDYTSTPFPGRGTLISKNGAPYPRIDISADLWSASAAIDLVDIAYGLPSGPDPVTCP